MAKRTPKKDRPQPPFGSEAHGCDSSPRTFRGSSAVTGPYRLKKKKKK